MADRIQTFTTKIFLNDDQAKNKIRELEKSISTIRADMSKAADAGDWSKFNSLKKELNQSTKELNSMRTTAQSVEHVLNNLGSSSKRRSSEPSVPSTKKWPAEMWQGTLRNGDFSQSNL